MSHSVRVDCLNAGTKGSAPVVSERVTSLVAGRGLGDSKDVGPLLDSLEKVLGIEGSIGGTMPELHLRASATETRVSTTNLVSPLLRGFDELSSGALTVPQVGTSETSVGNTREGRASLEEVRIGTQKHVGHHSTR